MIPIINVWEKHPQGTSRACLQTEPISSENVPPLIRISKQLSIKVILNNMVGVLFTPPAICPVHYRSA
eukprot:7542592-Heterocapsa_arctica.AAC.1